MERNKKVILIITSVVLFSGLFWFIYATVFKNKEQKKEPEGLQFEVPEISDENRDHSKIEYYNTFGSKNQTSKGFFLNDTQAIENDSLVEHILNYQGFEENDFNDNVSIDQDSQPDFINESTPHVEENEDLSRLLDIMESNTEHLNNNINGGTSTIKPDNSITDDKVLEQILEEIPDFKGNITPSSIDTATSNVDDDSNYNSVPKYKEIIEEKESPFLGATKNEYAFNGAFSDDIKVFEKELFQAEIYNTQVVENGGLIMIHLLEDVYFDKNYFVPKNTVLYGTAQFSPRRLFLRINPSIIENNIKLSGPMIVYDFDGLEGIYMNINQLANIPVETAKEITSLIQESYKNSNSIIPNSSKVPLKEAAIILGSEKTLRYLNRLKIKMFGGYKIWLSIDHENKYN